MSTLTLPAALQDWHPWLRWFAPELAAELGDLLRRMHPLLGRFQGQRQGGQPEPDGLGDLHRRGPYERLLASEWLLADEIPDEFLRRAAGGEHLFLAPRPRARQADRLILAVFDAGPWQLGAPRLAHLALWILLARRAVEAGGELRWGVLHRPGHWHAADSAEQLGAMLKLRTFEAAGAAHWQDWSQWQAQNATGVGECWWVGGDDTVAQGLPSGPTHAVGIRHGLAGDALDVVLRAGAVRRTLSLPLPAAAVGVRLLKGHFQNEISPQAHRKESRRLSLKHDPIVSPQGTQVAVRLLDGHGVMVFGVPRATDRKRRNPNRQQWTAQSELLGAAFSGKGFGAVLSQPQHLAFWQIPGLGVRTLPPRDAFEAPPGRSGLLPCAWFRLGGTTHVFVLDAARRLVWWTGSTSEVRGPMLLSADVLAMVAIPGERVAFVARSDHQLQVCLAGASGRQAATYRLALGLDPDPPVFLLGDASWGHCFGGCAVRMSQRGAPETWRVYDRAAVAAGSGTPVDSWEVTLPPGARAVGLVRAAGHPQAAVLVVQATNRRDFVCQGEHGSTPMYSAPDQVERVSVCPSSGIVALLTRKRELHVYATADAALRLVIHSGQGGEPADADAH